MKNAREWEAVDPNLKSEIEALQEDVYQYDMDKEAYDKEVEGLAGRQ